MGLGNPACTGHLVSPNPLPASRRWTSASQAYFSAANSPPTKLKNDASGGDLIRRQGPRDFRHRRGRSVVALAPRLEPMLEIAVRKPAEARNLADALRFGAVAGLAGDDVFIGNAVLKYRPALGDEGAVAVVGGFRRQRGKIRGQITRVQRVEMGGGVPHVFGRQEIVAPMGRKGSKLIRPHSLAVWPASRGATEKPCAEVP